MSATKLWTLQCDHPGCDARFAKPPPTGNRLVGMRTQAGAEGWTRGDTATGDRCPDHPAAVHRPRRAPRGHCRACPAVHSLTLDGRVRAHREVAADGKLTYHDCPGGGGRPRKATP